MGTWENCDAVERHPDRVGGAWVFRGTRVPVAALFENLRDGASIEEDGSGREVFPRRREIVAQALGRPDRERLIRARS